MSRQYFDSQFEGLERKKPSKVHSWVQNGRPRPDVDLLNVLSGYQARDESSPQDTNNLSALHALPLNGEHFSGTAAGRLITEVLQLSQQEMQTMISDMAIRNEIHRANIHDPESIKGLNDSLGNQYNVIERRRHLEQAVKQLTLEARLNFQNRQPLHINPDDSKATIEEKVAQQNKMFRQEMEQAKANILNEFKKDDSDPLFDTVSVIKGAIDAATNYTSNVLQHAATLEGDSRYQRSRLAEYVSLTQDELDKVTPEKQDQIIQHRIEVDRKKLKTIIESAKAGPERAALLWAIKEIRLETKHRQTRSDQDSQALTQHRQNPPADYKKHRQAIASKVRQARPIAESLGRFEILKARSQATQPILANVQNGIVLEQGLHQAIEDYLNGLPSPPADIQELEAQKQLEKSYIDVAILDQISQQNPTKANIKAFEEAKKNYDKDNGEGSYELIKVDHQINGNGNSYHEDDDVEKYILKIAKHRVEVQNTPPIEQHIYALAKARTQYQQGLQSLSGLLQTGNTIENPHPDVLKNLQKNADGLRVIYQMEVDRVHNEAGTLQTLQAVSSPLTALRAINSSMLGQQQNVVGNFMRYKDLSEHNKEGAARLDVLDISNYQLTLENLPRELIAINNLTGEINELLAEREQIERAIEADPSVVPQYADAIAKNTSALKSKLIDLQKETEKAERAGFLKTHPDIEAWAAKAGVLFDNVHRGDIRERNKVVNAALDFLRNSTVAGMVFNKLAGKGPGYVKGMEKPTYDPNAYKNLSAKVSTVYHVREGCVKTREETLKVEIQHPDGPKDEDVIFSGHELNKHFEDFIRSQPDLRVGKGDNDVQKIEGPGTVTYRWPSKELKDAWLDYLKKQYKQKREAELKEEHGHSAKVGVEGDSTAAAPSFSAGPIRGFGH